MIKYDRQDALLTATVQVPATASQTVTSEAVIDAGFPGSIDECQLVIEVPAIGSAGTVTLTVLSSDAADGEFSPTSAVFTAANADAPAEFRSRMPLDAKKFIKLQAVTDATAPGSAIAANLTLRV